MGKTLPELVPLLVKLLEVVELEQFPDQLMVLLLQDLTM